MADDGIDYSDMSGAGAGSPPPAGSDGPRDPVGAPEAVDPRRFLLPALMGGWVVLVAVLIISGLPLWLVGIVAVADLAAMFFLARSLGRGSTYGR